MPDKEPNLEAQRQDRSDAVNDEGHDEAALWEEFDQAERATAAPDPDSPPGAPPGEDEPGSDGGAASAGGGADVRTDDAAKQAGGEPSPSAKGTSDSDKLSDATQTDIWANASPDQRAAYEAAQAQIKRLEQAERSQRGRLSALQRQINELMSQRRTQQAASQGAASTEAQGDVENDADSNYLGSDEWKSFAEEYPEVAAPLGKLIGGLQAEVIRQRKELAAIGKDRREEALAEQEELLNEEHPDWQDVTADAEFVSWLNQQPRHIREAAIRNADEIVDAAEAADVVGRFKGYRAARGQGTGGAQQPSRADSGRGSGTTQALSGKRQRQLESAAAARSRGPGVASGIPEDGDPETLWKQFDEMERRQARV